MLTRARTPVTAAFALALLVPSGAGADVSGVALYESVPSTSRGLDYGGSTERPVRGARIQLRSASDALVSEAVTGDDGSFRLSPGAGGDLELILIAESPDPPVAVEDNTDGDALWAVSFSPVNDGASVTLVVPSGWQGGGYDPGSRLAGPFAILDAAYQAAQLFRSQRSVSFPPLLINWSPDNRPEGGDKAAGQIGTSSWDGNELYILGKEDVDTDEYDTHVMVHEWGHYFESRLSRSDSIGGSHGQGDLLDARVAFGEGWGNALSAMVLFPDSEYTDSLGGGQADGFGYDLEDNFGRDPAPGWFSEASVQSILYDLFDANGDGADRVSLGIGPLYDVMVGHQRSTRALTSIFSFVTGLKDVAPGSAGDVDALLAQHAMQPINDSFGASETNDAGSPDNLPVYRVVEIGGAAVTLGFDGGQPTNWVGQNRYLGFVGNGGSVTVSASTNADVLLAVLDGGNVVGLSDGFFAGTETVSFTTVTDAVYVIAVGGFEAAGRYESTVQVTSP